MRTDLSDPQKYTERDHILWNGQRYRLQSAYNVLFQRTSSIRERYENLECYSSYFFVRSQ
jgi:hypothetical protein